MFKVVKNTVQHEGCWEPLTEDIREYCKRYEEAKRKMDTIKTVLICGLFVAIAVVMLVMKKQFSLIQPLFILIAAGFGIFSYKMINEYKAALYRVLRSDESEYAVTILKDVVANNQQTAQATNQRGFTPSDKRNRKTYVTLAFSDEDETYVGSIEANIGDRVLVVKPKSIVSIESKYCFKIPFYAKEYEEDSNVF